MSSSPNLGPRIRRESSPLTRSPEIAWRIVILLVWLALASGDSLRCTCRDDSIRDKDLLCAEDRTLGCVVVEAMAFPSWDILSSGFSLLPERTTLLMALSEGSRVVLASPPDSHAVLASAMGLPSSLTVLHPSLKALHAVTAMLSLNGLSPAYTLHGFAATSDVGVEGDKMLPHIPLTLEEYYANTAKSRGHREKIPTVQWPVLGEDQSLLVVHQGFGQREMVLAAKEMCSGACNLAVSLGYDAEGGVFSAHALAILETLRALEHAGGHRCFFHMSEWAGGDASMRWGNILGPVLDVVCMHSGDARKPPENAKILWNADVNRQLAAFITAFAPNFTARCVRAVER